MKKIAGIKIFTILTVITGVIYPLFILLLGNVFFKEKSQGSLIIGSGGKIIGSKLIAQPLIGEKYFLSRDSLVKGPTNIPYNSYEYNDLIIKKEKFLKEFNGNKVDIIPLDLITSSASGLDPHISLESANYQIERVAKNRDMEIKDVSKILDKYKEGKNFGFLGEEKINVLLVNLELDNISKIEK